MSFEAFVVTNISYFLEGATLHAAATETGPFLIEDLYALLGRELVPIDIAPAGVICAIGLKDWLPGTTLCSIKLEKPLAYSTTALEPLVRVTIQASGGQDEWDELRNCLKQLAVLDSAVRVIEQENGDLALITAGEVHLQKCIQDLNDMGLVDITVSEPIVPFLETIIPDTNSSYTKLVACHLTECFMKQFGLRLKLRAVPLHDDVVKYLSRNDAILKGIKEGTTDEKILKHFRDGLLEVSKSTLPSMKGTIWTKKNETDFTYLIDRIWSFGPFKAKYNILINGIEEYDRSSIWESKSNSKKYWPLDRALIAGFDLAMCAGPLCQEPLQGVVILVEDWKIEKVEKNDEEETEEDAKEVKTLAELNDPQIHGQLISAMKATCKAALDKHPRRLVAAMYKIKVQTSSQALGKVHSVLAQRRAKVSLFSLRRFEFSVSGGE